MVLLYLLCDIWYDLSFHDHRCKVWTISENNESLNYLIAKSIPILISVFSSTNFYMFIFLFFSFFRFGINFFFLQCIGGEKIARRMFRIDFWYKYINCINSTIIAHIYCDYNIEFSITNTLPTLFIFIFYFGHYLWFDWCYQIATSTKTIISTEMIGFLLVFSIDWMLLLLLLSAFIPLSTKT